MATKRKKYINKKKDRIGITNLEKKSKNCFYYYFLIWREKNKIKGKKIYFAMCTYVETYIKKNSKFLFETILFINLREKIKKKPKQ